MEAVLVVPVLMLLLLLVVQFVLWGSAAHVAEVAASEGDRIARSAGGGNSAGQAAALSVLDGPGSDVTSGTALVTDLPGGETELTVTGTVSSVVPWVTLHVTATVAGPAQTFRGSE